MRLCIIANKTLISPGVANQSESKNHISYCVTARATSWTWANM